jgi:hypothetical protein
VGAPPLKERAGDRQVTSPKYLNLVDPTPLICSKQIQCEETKPVLTLQARPQLATHCYFLANASKADVLWTRDDFRALCHRMLNGNGDHNFMLCYFDEAKRKAVFPRARLQRASKTIDWAFDTIRGGAKRKTGIGFYPTNDDDESCWGALDFDAHNVDERLGRAYQYAGKAFDLLCREAPALWVIAGTSGQTGGWHIFIFAPFFYPISDWIRLLREVADRIGAPIEKGVCEIFPDHYKGKQKGIRAPGSWNPKDESFGLIAFDGLTPELKAKAKEIKNSSLYATLSSEGRKQPLPNWKASLPNCEVPLFRGEDRQWKKDFAITAPSERNAKLCSLVGTAFWQAAEWVVRENAQLQYDEATPTPEDSLDTHFEEFERLWRGMEREWLGSLSVLEREKFNSLTNDNDREGCRIAHNWQKADDSPDFKIVCESLAARLRCSVPTASSVRNRLCAARILRQTAPYVPHRLAARYEWSANQ